MPFVLIFILGISGYTISGNSFFDSAYMMLRMFLFDADTHDNNILVEIARWLAPVLTVSGLFLILKTVFGKIKDFFVSFYADAVAVYGDAELKKIVKDNVKHAINGEDNDVMDVNRHIIMYKTDEQSLEFYKAYEKKLRGEVFIKIDENDSFSVSLDNVKFFNPCEIIARNFWQENDIRQVIKEPKMKIAIVGSDILSRKILTYGLLNNIYSLRQEIEYHIWSENDFFEEVHKDFVTMNGDSIIYHDCNAKDKMYEIAASDRIIITDKVNNAFLAEITKLSQGEIYCFDPMGIFINIFNYSKLYSFGNYKDILTEENIRTDNLYTFAKKLNHQYAVQYAEDKNKIPTVEEAWNKLDSFTKGSNVASSDYHGIRLIVMETLGKTDVDDELSEMEHIRWCRYHFINHWKYGETPNGKKDPVNRIHPCLVPFGELSDTDKKKDADGIVTLLGI